MDSHALQQPIPPPEADNSAQPLSMPGNKDGTVHENHDWTADLPETDHVRFFRNTDWARSALGPLQDWSPTLRTFTNFVLADSRAACLWWGPRLVAVYNEAYAPLAAQKHPSLMGSPFREGYAELWPSISAYFDQCKRTGTGVEYSPSDCLLVERKGWKEETYFSGSFTPIGPRGHPLGFYNFTFEVTNQKLSDRRTVMLNLLAAAPDQTVDAVFAHILTTLETNPRDVPLAMLYRFEDTTLKLQGHIGLRPDHGLVVESAYIESETGLIPDMRRAGFEAAVMDCDQRFSSASWKGWGYPSHKIAILPIASAGDLLGYLIVGTNPFRPYDDACQQFIRDLNRMVSSVISAAVEFERSKKRQEQLEADLAFSDLKLRHLIEHASVGMCHISLDGQMLWANEHYYRLSGSGPEKQAKPYGFLDTYLDDERIKALEVFEGLQAGDSDHVTVEVRLKRMYSTPSGEEQPAQIQVLAFPYRDPETSLVKSIMACTTDISRLKWAEDFQARLAAEAREAKRQQEAFIDVVSHEMRNPLSAIVHSADAITGAVAECHAKLADVPAPCIEALADNLHSASIILQCANHQRRIIDDVLTLSKLDSMLLSITPVSVKPVKLISSIIDMFEPELGSNHIDYQVTLDPSLSRMCISHVYLDPSRVTQVFINLLTNAIKFVKPSKEPLISIRTGACQDNPRAFFPENMFWATESKPNDEVTNSPEWGTGEELYLAFSVKDSGIGLHDKEIVKIFERFRQANVKTHVKYGGSGLGLFISKELTERQGGEIGVSSVLGQGSTFGFYVKTRRAGRGQATTTGLPHRKRESISEAEQLHVLLVEDNLINQQVLKKQLKKAGCKVDVANHGLEALNLLDECTFDIVLMDSEMPVLDGLAATRAIRQKELAGEGLLGKSITSGPRAGSRLPIIAVTANVRKEQIDQAMAAGADGVMQKPFKADELVDMMKSLVLSTAASDVVGERSGLP